MDYRSYDNCHGKVNVFGTDGHEDGVVGTDEDGTVDRDGEAVTMTTIEKRERGEIGANGRLERNSREDDEG